MPSREEIAAPKRIRAIRVALSGIGGKGHSNSKDGYVMGISKEWEGVLVTVGTPHAPTYHYICGTDLVWPILDEEVISKEGRRLRGIGHTLCRHQILAGD